MDTTDYDVIIIGTGAGGGTMARALAATGKRILILERGDFLPREKQNWDSYAVNRLGRYKAEETWLDRRGREFHPSIHYWVGGNTKFYGAALIRMRPRDFAELLHHGGVSPAWPIDYTELEPHYVAAEHMYKVHGQHGVDPTEGPASADYAYPAISHEPAILELCEAMRQNGQEPFPMPIGIDLDETDARASTCIRCNTCDGYPCLVDGKSDAHVIGIERALTFPNVTLLTRALVTRLETDASGRSVRQVVVERDGVSQRYSADIVVLAAGAINSAVLLLRSASAKHPQGLANSSGAVGRHYMAHNNTGLLCISPRLNPTSFQKTMGLNDYYWGASDSDRPLGHISLLGKMDGTTMKTGAGPLVPTCLFDRMARHSFDFWLTSEDLPDAANRVELTSGGRIKLSYVPNNLEAHVRLVAKLKQIIAGLLPFGLKLDKRIPLAGTAHQCGTLRFGDDPRSSVLDRNCRAHDLDNLYVADSSFFVSSAAVNPALTIMANALRVAREVERQLVA
jgi:choline dehydrogenase-like flavoprotein